MQFAERVTIFVYEIIDQDVTTGQVFSEIRDQGVTTNPVQGKDGTALTLSDDVIYRLRMRMRQDC